MATKKQAKKKEIIRTDAHCRVMTDLFESDDAIQSWRIFRIMSEFVDGFEILRKYGMAATFFGSARSIAGDDVYKSAEELAAKLAKSGFAIITGGGPGVMEAANVGGFKVGGQSVGLNIKLPMEQVLNPYVTESESFHFFFSRKVMLSFASEVYVYFPGGFGTMDEFFEIVTLIQTKKISPIPVVLYDSDYWNPLLDFFKKTLLKEYKTISKEDLDIFHIVDSVDDAYEYIMKNVDGSTPRQKIKRMEKDYLERIQTFDIDSLPDLDEVVLGSLQFLGGFDLPTIDTETYRRPLVIGSVNAFRTGRVIFDGTDAVFADEGSYHSALEEIEHIDAVYVISASGGKHATQIAKDASELDVPLFLITNNTGAPAAAYVPEENVLLFPHIREPYSYNTSTYLSMILSARMEQATDILSFIESEVAPRIPKVFGEKKAFTLILPVEFDTQKGLFQTKFDELFGPELVGRAFTVEQVKHAKTIVSSDKEFFISFGGENTLFGTEENRLTIPLPEKCGPAGMMAIGYYVIGHIQKQHPPYFKEKHSCVC